MTSDFDLSSVDFTLYDKKSKDNTCNPDEKRERISALFYCKCQLLLDFDFRNLAVSTHCAVCVDSNNSDIDFFAALKLLYRSLVLSNCDRLDALLELLIGRILNDIFLCA